MAVPFRVVVQGPSMEPGLRDGDWIVCLPPRRLPRVGDLVVAVDPFNAPALIVKRVSAVDGGSCRLSSDSAAHRAHFSDRAVLAREILGFPAFRYAPLSRLGPVR